MSINKEIFYVKKHLYEIEDKYFLDALSSFSSRDDLIIALLKSIGFDEVFEEVYKEKECFYAVVQDVRVDLVSYNEEDNVLTGSAASDVGSAFDIVKAIEGELTNALDYPPELRRRVVESVISDAGVNSDFFKKILTNWKSYR